ncbi:MAG TPA: hypothetical protein VF737_13195 [Gemmatimonadaceae bacterium]
MRKATLMTAALVSALAVLPRTAPAQVNVSVAIGARLGPDVGIFAYSAPRYGDWRVAYMQWTPVVVYEVRGRYYPHAVRGARAVAVYRFHDEYFFPPRDRAWVRFDRRYDYRDVPDRDDWKRARSHASARGQEQREEHAKGRGRGRGGWR